MDLPGSFWVGEVLKRTGNLAGFSNGVATGITRVLTGRMSTRNGRPGNGSGTVLFNPWRRQLITRASVFESVGRTVNTWQIFLERRNYEKDDSFADSAAP